MPAYGRLDALVLNAGIVRPAVFSSGRIQLAVNGVTKQEGDIADLIWDCAETIAYISRFERLLPGDLIYTGTPAGVGPVHPGDIIDVTIAGLMPLKSPWVRWSRRSVNDTARFFFVVGQLSRAYRAQVKGARV